MHPIWWLHDYGVAVGGLVAAVASTIAAFMSWRAANAANRLNAEHWQAERDAAELRIRRGLAVEIREWLNVALWNASTRNVAAEAEMNQIAHDLQLQCDRDGQSEGRRLLKHLRGVVDDRRNFFKRASAKEIAIARHPSRWSTLVNEPTELVDQWEKSPVAITPFLDSHDSVKLAASREALLRLAEQMRAEQAGQAAPEPDGDV